MKKLFLFATAAVALIFAACSNSESSEEAVEVEAVEVIEEAPEVEAVEVEAVEDSAAAEEVEVVEEVEVAE